MVKNFLSRWLCKKNKSNNSYIKRIEKLTNKLNEKDLEIHAVNNFLKNITKTSPDMFWAKDNNDNFTFTNKPLRDRLLLNGKVNPIGKSGIFFAKRQIKLGNKYDFGFNCSSSDDVVKQKMKSCLFLEDGNIGGKYLALLVHKAPLIQNGKLIGTVGTGRDVTRVVKDHRELNNLLQKIDKKNLQKSIRNDLEEFKRLFDIHANRYYFTLEPESKLIKVFE